MKGSNLFGDDEIKTDKGNQNPQPSCPVYSLVVMAMITDVLEAVVQFIPRIKTNWKAVFPIIPRKHIFNISDLAREKLSRLTKSAIIRIMDAKKRRIPLNPRGENSRSAILIKEKFTAQQSMAASIRMSVFPKPLCSSI
jgi:hypothetical protein